MTEENTPQEQYLQDLLFIFGFFIGFFAVKIWRAFQAVRESERNTPDVGSADNRDCRCTPDVPPATIRKARAPEDRRRQQVRDQGHADPASVDGDEARPEG